MNLRERILKMPLLTIVLFSFIVNYGYSQNLIKNPGFETGSVYPYWGSWPKGSSYANIDNNNAYEGTFCVKLEANEVYFYQPINLEPNTTYKVIATIKSESGDSILFGVSNVNSEEGKGKYFNDTNYKTDSLYYTTDESPGNQPNIYIWKKDGSGIVWIDNIKLIIEPVVNEPKPPGGFLSTFYVSPLGNDSNTGESFEQAWQTIDKVNSIDFGPGDQILFEGGETFNGTIVLNQDDYGTLDNKVHVGSYGQGRAIINAQTGSGLIAYDCSNISIKNLNFVGDGRNGGNTGNGITFSYCSEIIIDGVEISGFQHSGLMLNSIGENYQITNVNAHDNGYSGIYLSGMDKTLLSNIYIGYCNVYNNPGDPTVLDNHSGNGIFAYEASNIIIEYCEASNNGWDMPRKGNGPGGIWVAEVDNAVIQHCISHDNKTSDGGLDGLGFDLDGGTTNSVIQYCLSYNNHGAGYGIFQYPGASSWSNNTVRYCISENDGNVSAPGSVYFWNGEVVSQFQGFEFYNNTVYNTNGPALAFLDHKNLDFNFRNNIFVSKISNVYNRINGENFQGNCWFSLTNDVYTDSLNFIAWAQTNNQEMLNGEIVGMYANPNLTSPGNSNLTDPTQLKFVDDYKLQDSSTIIDAGLDLNVLFNVDPGEQDFYGSAIKKGLAFDIGVHEHSDTAVQVQQLSLTAGWNIISFRVVPQDSDMLNIVQPLIDLGVLKKVMDESGNVIEDWGSFGGWKNFIGSVHNSEGYKVNVTDDATLKIDGVAVVLAYEIPLNNGWNIISWPSANEQNGNDVFQSLINDGKLKKVMDESGYTIEDLGVYGGWKNNIGNFKPGEGYKVNVTAACTLTIYESSVKSDEIIPEVFASSYFVPDYKGNGTDHMNINLVNLPDSGIKEGDEIGIFDGDICVGSAQIVNLFQSAREISISIAVSAADGIEGNNGYLDGNPIIIKLFRDGVEYPLSIEPINVSNAVFRKGSSLFAQVDILTGLKEIAPVKTAEVKCYPNPFSEELNIKIYLTKDAEVLVEVLNQLGQRVTIIKEKNLLTSGTHLLNWNGKDIGNKYISPGVYLVRIIVNGVVSHRKIILSN